MPTFNDDAPPENLTPARIAEQDLDGVCGGDAGPAVFSAEDYRYASMQADYFLSLDPASKEAIDAVAFRDRVKAGLFENDKQFL